MISLDTETTGLDLRHGARPYFVTVCKEDGEQQWWEWHVNPETREPEVSIGDMEEIKEAISGQIVVGQNLKFDVAALSTLDDAFHKWSWERTHDTLIAGHLLASNRPHDLTSMALEYLGIDIEPFDKKLEQACTEARRMVQQARLRNKRAKPQKLKINPKTTLKEVDGIAQWRIAERGLEEMPSAKEKCWKFDGWLPRAMAEHKNYPKDHPWYTVLRDYANTDSATTLMLWQVMEKEVRGRGLWKLYEERMKIPPVVFKMEQTGLTLSKSRLEEKRTEFSKRSNTAGAKCIKVAAEYGCTLTLPKAGNNKSLQEAALTILNRMAPTGVHIQETDTGLVSLNKLAIDGYIAELPGSARDFFEALRDKRGGDTARGFMEAYERFWLSDKPNGEWYRLFPSINQTGTDTLRFSCQNPNSQQISKREGFNLRYLFGPAPGREWWSLDAKNIELRIPAYESGEKELIDLFEHPDDPPYYGSTHLLNFHTVYPDLWERELKGVGFDNVGPHCKKKYAPTWYQWVKNGGFAIQYGAQKETADRAFHRPGSYERLKSRFSKLEVLNQKWIAFAEKHGYVETIPDRTVDPHHGYPLLCARTEWGKVLPTVPLNYHVSGTAMWHTAKGMVRCQGQLDEWERLTDFDGRIVIQQHDEMVFDFPAGKGEEPWKTNLPKIRKIQRLMEEGGRDVGIPTPVGVEYHANNWSEGRTL